MKSIIRLYILLTFFIGTALASYAQADKSDIFVLEGHRQMTLGNHSDAFELIRHALELNPKSVAALEEMGEFWHFMHNDSMAIVYMSKAAEYAPNDYWVQQPLVELYVNSGKYDEAIHLLEEMSVKYPAKEDILMMLESLYQQKGDFKSVIGVLNKLELKEGKSEQLSREKFRTYMQMGDEEHAFAEISALADEYPNDLRYRVLLGDMHVGQQHFDEALKVYKSVEAEDPTNISLMASMLPVMSGPAWVLSRTATSISLITRFPATRERSSFLKSICTLGISLSAARSLFLAMKLGTKWTMATTPSAMAPNRQILLMVFGDIGLVILVIG